MHPSPETVTEAMDEPNQEATEDTIDTRVSVIRRRPDGIVEGRDKPLALIDLEDAKALVAATRALMPGRLPCPLLVVPGTAELTRPAREYFSQSDDAVAVFARMAFVITSPLSRVIATVFMGLKKPKYPAAAFRSEAEAVAWLLAPES